MIVETGEVIIKFIAELTRRSNVFTIIGKIKPDRCTMIERSGNTRSLMSKNMRPRWYRVLVNK